MKREKWPGYNWKIAECYDLSKKTPGGIAWEFLRRNNEYLRNYRIYKKTKTVPLIPDGNPNALDMREYFGIHKITDPFKTIPPFFYDEECNYPWIPKKRGQISHNLEKNEIGVIFSIDHNIEKQLEEVKIVLKSKQTELHGNTRNTEKPFNVYLRILDADQDPSKPTDQLISDTIFKDLIKNPKEISGYRSQAEALRDGGYRNIINS